MTLFEKIIRREIPAKIAFEDADVIAIHDVNPQAPVHVLIIPKRVIARVGAAEASDTELLGKLLVASPQIARDLGILETGYRLIINHGPSAKTAGHQHRRPGPAAPTKRKRTGANTPIRSR